MTIDLAGPPSQSLGVDPVNREVMRRPPRSKNAPVLSKRLLYRIAFSASMIVMGTLFIYAEELSDGDTAQRDQTMVGPQSLARDATKTSLCFVCVDIYLFRLSRSRFRNTESRVVLRLDPKSHARLDSWRIFLRTASPHLLPTSTGCVPDRSSGLPRPVRSSSTSRSKLLTPRTPKTLGENTE